MTEKQEESSSGDKTKPTLFPQIVGIRVRKRVDPAVSPKILYTIKRTFTTSIRGRRTHYQILKDGQILYSAKLKSKRQSEPIPISNGSDAHYSSTNNAAYLLCGDGRIEFSLRAKDQYGPEVITIQHSHIQNDKHLPKTLKVTLFLKDSLIPHKLISKQPQMTDDMEWVLDFHNKELIPSTKNIILINEENTLEYLLVRKVSKDTLEADAVSLFSPLAVFGVALSLYVAPV
ncbi:hypothetical protein TVAG_305530 [Trichomonas vaginalis G3]|uniref:Tubby C-terminal domain-containing protein n=1 Tax=Trichomonas vaginalis (strain ATCC PRA-98 / G3) TaxID=412133 RepID=A2ERC7_TRIV3|nr:tubby protein, chain A domain-containing protein [Trichomonas vaginalis G3]EAY04803.1 hypothetical protein TVAG_305530 [Trichomonas vaginalis G3]KAI5491004.1 tubby protein, chain A domain-containing protein [Trichomonas vaginalis G3]|eukprot:XP_001317026.1 hypothetical protein [Trichomonas vaginalis G3]